MSDLGETFRAYRQDGKRRAADHARRDVAQMLELQRNCLIVAQQLSDHHWRISGIVNGKVASTVDYWPSRGTICKKGERLTAFGLKAAVRIARNERKPR